MVKSRLICIAFFMMAASSAGSAADISPRDALHKGVDLAEAGRHREAMRYFLIAYRASPDNDAVLWNLGLASAELNDHATAVQYWLAYRKARPDDWRFHAKLIQAYQALGNVAARDRERSALFTLRQSSSPDAEINRIDSYCREQMVISGRRFLAFEFFDPQGERRVYFVFIALTDKGNEEFRISLGSYEATNQYAWERGTLPRNERLYHLDRYDPAGHQTYGFFRAKPTYEFIRAKVDDIMNGRAKPTSGVTRQ